MEANTFQSRVSKSKRDVLQEMSLGFFSFWVEISHSNKRTIEKKKGGGGKKKKSSLNLIAFAQYFREFMRMRHIYLLGIYSILNYILLGQIFGVSLHSQ